MKRPLWLVGMSFLLAIGAAFNFPVKQSIIASIIFLSCAIGLYFLSYKISSKKLFVLSIILAAVSVGFAIYCRYVSNKVLPFDQYKGKNIAITGIVEERRSYSDRSVRYTVFAQFPETELPASRIIIRDYIGTELTAGDNIQTVIKFDSPKYDTTQSFYSREGIPGEGIMLEQPIITPTASNNNIRYAVVTYRAHIYNKINKLFSPESAALINSMTFGLTQDIDSSFYNSLNRSGISHLLSVSGMHLSIFTGCVMLLLSSLKLKPSLSYILAMVCAFIFAILVGLSPAIVRALIMTVVYLFGKLINRESDSLNSIGISAIIIGIIWPYWVLSLGLWLSFFATTGIVESGFKIYNYLYDKLSLANGKFYNKIVAVFTTTIGVTIGAYIYTLPILVFSFGWASLISPLANLLVAPFASIIVILGISVVLLPVGFPFYPVFIYILELSCKMLIEISYSLSRLSFSVITFDNAISIIGFAAAFVIALVFIKIKKQSFSIAGITLCILFVVSSTQLVSALTSADNNQFYLTQDNQLIVVKEKSAVVFIKPDIFSVNEIIKLLDYKGVHTIDVLICKEYDGQSTAIFKRLSENYRINSAIGSSDDYSLDMLAKNLPGVEVFSSKNVTVNALGNLTINFNDDNICSMTSGSQKIVLSDQNYDIIKAQDKNAIYIADNNIILPNLKNYGEDIMAERIYKTKSLILNA